MFFPEECKSFSGFFFVYDTFASFSFDFEEINIIFYKNSCSFSSWQSIYSKEKKL